MPSWRTVAREPLVHFIAIGAVIFAIDAWRADDPPAQPSEPAPATPVEAAPPPTSSSEQIVVTPERRERARTEAERRLGRTPTADEVRAEIERWIDEEVLVREAIARGLDRDDPVIHQRIASRMAFVLEQSLVAVEPTEAELRAYFEKHRARWVAPERIDFTHVFVATTDPTGDAAATARIDELLAALTAGQPPDRLGDTFAGGRRYRGRKLADLALAFGDDFVAGLATQPIGTWQRRVSKHGLHVVRVDRVEAGQTADFAKAKLDVRKAFLEERRAAAIGDAIRKLRSRWEIVER